MWRRAIRANSAAVKSPNPATSSFGGVVQGAGHRVLQHARAAGQDECDAALARRHQRRGVDDGGNAQATGSTDAGSEAQFEDGIGGGGPDHAVDVAGGDAGIGQRAQRGLERNRRRIVPAGQSPGLRRVVDPDDGDVTEGMCSSRTEQAMRSAGAGGIAAPCRSP